MKRLLIGAMVLMGVLNPMSAHAQTFFTDVATEHPNSEAIAYMRATGVVEGYSDGEFKPDSNINRAEFLKVILEAQDDFTKEAAEQCLTQKREAGQTYAYLTDVDLTSWYSPYICYGVEKGIIDGYPDGTYKPAQNINIPEMAKIVVNTQDLSPSEVGDTAEWFETYMDALEKKAALPTSLQQLPDAVRRGEMVEVLFRVKENVDDKPATTLAKLQGVEETYMPSGDLGDITSCSDLATLLEQARVENENKYTTYYEDDVMLESVMDTAGDDGAAARSEEATGTNSSDLDYSTTNVQVAGVDEADIVKNDARFIYSIKGDQVKIVDTQAATGGLLEEVASISVSDTDFQPTELMVRDNQLVVIGYTYKENNGNYPTPYYFEEAGLRYYPPYHWREQYVKVVLVDITNRKAPKVERSLSYEGNLSQSRRVDNMLYLVMNDYPTYSVMREPGRHIEELIPAFSDTTATKDVLVPAVGCADIQYFPGYLKPNMLIIAAIDLDDEKQASSNTVLLGESSQIYMSTENLYVATGAASEGEQFWRTDSTQIYKFALNGTQVTKVATAKVPGRIINQFSMDESKGYFRIATTTDSSIDNDWTTSNNVYVLDSDLDMMGSLTGLAKGERIYSTRFMGDRLYMVTFKSVDPFFVIDLKDPTSPKVLGELKIPGFSDYLHPYDANHVIGFGKDVEVEYDENGEMIELDRLPWDAVGGLKVSLFDVTDVSNPIETHKIVIGDRGTTSDLLHDHKALLFDKNKDLLAFPITVMESSGETVVKECRIINSVEECEEVRTYEDIDTTFVGAIVLNIDVNDGFSERGRITHFPSNYWPTSDYDWEYRQDRIIKRILYIADKLYSVSQGYIKSSDMSSTDTIQMLELQ